MKKTTRRLRWATAAALSAGLAAPALAEDRALLIGINDYLDQRIDDLRGCEADVEAMKRILVQDYAFPEKSIHTLLSRQATRAAILAEIDSFLVAGTRPGDRVLFYYSGHGSQMKCPRPKPEELDGLDEIFCPTDFNPQTQANGIIDDELQERLRKLDGRDVIVIVDACHSGSITKSINGQLRGVETLDTAQSVPKYIPPPNDVGVKDIFYRPPTAFAANSPMLAQAGQLVSDGRGAAAAPAEKGGAQILAERINYIALTSCADEQRSEEIRVEIGNRYARRGAFTWILAEGLAGPADLDRDGRITYQEILDYVQQRMRDPHYDLAQRPELRTRPEFFRQPFLGRVLGGGGRPKVIEVRNGAVTINRGAQQGVAVKQMFEPATAPPSADGATVQIENVDQFTATGRIVGNLDLKQGDALRPKDIHYKADGLTLWLAPSPGFAASGDLARQVRDRLKNVADVQLVERADLANRTLRLEQAGGRVTAALYSQYGALRGKKEYNGLAECLNDLPTRLNGELLVLQLARLENRQSDIELSLWVEGGRADFIAYRNETKQQTLRCGFRASKDCYLTIISINSAGEILFDLLQADFQARAGRTYTLPPENEEPWKVYPPAGRDFVYALATSKPLSARQKEEIKSKGVKSLAGEEGIKTVGPARKPPPNGGNAPAARLEDVLQLAREGWATALVTIDSVEEE